MDSETVRKILGAFPSAELLPDKEVLTLSVDGPQGVVIEVLEDGIRLNLFKYIWTTVYTRLSSHEYWRTLPRDLPPEDLIDQINRARRARKRRFKHCSYCFQRFPPELMTGQACHPCASRFEGIIY